MANDEHLAILKQGVEVWNKWRAENPEVMPDLGHINLNDANLAEINLSGAYLGGAYLLDTNLNLAKLIEANLADADLRGVNLHGANLSGAYLGHITLIGVKLHSADLCGADLSNAILYKSDLTEANLTQANMSKVFCDGILFCNVDLSDVKGLETIHHSARSYVDVLTLYRTKGNIPDVFLRGSGIPEDFITFLPSLTGRAIEFYSCFISYSHMDKAFAKRLHDTLQGQGIRCWLDEKQIKPGHDIAQEIDRGIKYWDKTILCCSKSAMTEKWWVSFEMKKALAKEQDLMRERGQHIRAIIPLDLDGYLLGDYAGEYRSEIMSRSVANFKGWKRSQKIWGREIERVISALRTDEGREIQPTPKL